MCEGHDELLLEADAHAEGLEEALLHRDTRGLEVVDMVELGHRDKV